jgi:hypothetical protein
LQELEDAPSRRIGDASEYSLAPSLVHGNHPVTDLVTHWFPFVKGLPYERRRLLQVAQRWLTCITLLAGKACRAVRSTGFVLTGTVLTAGRL